MRDLVITVARKPLAKRNVALNVMAYEVGALHIDATRIKSDEPPLPARKAGFTSSPVYGDAVARVVYAPSPGGRWPANLVLQHLPGCRCVGTRRVKTGTAGAQGRGFRSQYVGGEPTSWAESEQVTYAEGDGKETIAAWECVSGCPVSELDVQSAEGGMHSAGHQRDHAPFNSGAAQSEDSFLGRLGGGDYGAARYGDDGGASRFFKTFGSDDGDR